MNDALLASIVREVAPLVSSLTGWDLHLATLHCRVIPKDQGYERILLGRMQGLKAGEWQDMMPDFIERIIEYMAEENILAAYMPATDEILVLRENVDDSNLDGLKLILAHELVHRGQHMNHGRLFVQIDQLQGQAFSLLRSADSNLDQLRQILGNMQPIMTLLESHATYIQESIRQANFPDACIESHFNLAILIMRLVGAPKTAQYTEGLPQVHEAAKLGRLESLYSNLGG